ncbi:hypothetical protein MRB53_011042 [Persea americana]|uniref:Uncharacterized protein n=1 Tax=Persea americana TaxID=3435 RepID=A0ACC2LTP9_PERAE|nr:hypothetical protein MRB53_011042 [Persea americana]
MHDLFHDLAQFVMGNECCVAEEGKLVKISKRVRHVSCFDSTLSEMLRDSLLEARMLRTFISYYGDGLHLRSDVGHFRFSRVLDLNTFTLHDVKQLLAPQDDLKHIRKIEEQILQGLQPHGNMEVLMLSNYGGIQFPSWMMDTTLAMLQKIKLVQCVGLKHLPPLGQLPSLKVLELIRLQNVEYIGDEIYGNVVSAEFPSLEELTIRGMGKLRIWSGRKSRRIFPRLVKLKIYDCPMLTKVVLFPYSEHLTIDSSLVSGAEPLCQGMLQNLTHLKIANCTQLEDVRVGLQNLTTLKSMSLRKCDLLSFPVEEMRGLIALQELTIDSGDRLISFSKELHHICLLKSLKMKGCYKSIAFPNEISFLTGLQVLKLLWCDLESLPERLGNLTSLHHLSIESCRKITSLPKELQRLTVLKSLCILRCCPVLARQCEINIGEDWHKIQHIPHICLSELSGVDRRWRQQVKLTERLVSLSIYF